MLKQEDIKSPLGSEYNSSKEATSIRMDVPIPPERFEIPRGVEVTDMFKDLAKSIEKAQGAIGAQAENYRKELTIKAKTDPEAAKELKELTTEDGKIDANRYFEIMKNKSYIALAKATLRSIATAAESYATSHQGNYPADEASLTGANPPYLSLAYCGNTVSGYIYSCKFDKTGYTITATASPGTFDPATYTISTGGVLTP